MEEKKGMGIVGTIIVGGVILVAVCYLLVFVTAWV